MENLHNPQPEKEHGADAGAPDELAPEAQGDNDETQGPLLFSSDDLAVLDARSEAPKPFEDATRLLVDLCLSPENMYGNGNPYFGRFAFCEAEQTAIQTRAMFRLLRGALDFLEEDYLSCEEEERVHLRARLTAFEQLSGAGALGEEVRA